MNEVNANNLRRREILSLNRVGPSVYKNPHDCGVEPIEAYLVLYRKSNETALHTVHSENGKTSVLLMLGKRKVYGLYTQDPELHLSPDDLVFSDAQFSEFHGQMMIFVQFASFGYACWFVDTTISPAKVTSIWSTQENPSDVLDFAHALAKLFQQNNIKGAHQLLLEVVPEEENTDKEV